MKVPDMGIVKFSRRSTDEGGLSYEDLKGELEINYEMLLSIRNNNNLTQHTRLLNAIIKWNTSYQRHREYMKSIL